MPTRKDIYKAIKKELGFNVDISKAHTLFGKREGLRYVTDMDGDSIDCESGKNVVYAVTLNDLSLDEWVRAVNGLVVKET